VSDVAGIHTFDEPEVRTNLAGSEEDIGKALTSIHEHLRHRLCGWIRKRFPGLSPEDLASTWSDTLACVLEATKRGRFDSSRPLIPWLCQILTARAIDHTRRRAARQEVLIAVGHVLRSTRLGRFWQTLRAVKRNELMQLVRDALETLPAQQQRVFQIYLEHYPESRSMELLQREVSRATGCMETLAAVKRALQEGREKVRTFLRRGGYTLGEFNE
jgi:RNA polymerase sigma factor (sigma-70 family)